MTHRSNREQDRAVKAYKRAHPGITMDQARKAVAARSSQPQSLPTRIPAAPLPRPAERLDGYVKRVAAAAGVQRHRAMELLGLQPGASATERLDELAAGLPDDAVWALVAATGMTTDQARALTAPLPARLDVEAVRRLAEENFAAGHYRRGGEGKTRTSLELATALALRDPRVRLIDIDAPPPLVDTDPQRSLDWPGPAPSPWILLDTPWPADGRSLPADPELLDEILKTFSNEQGTDADTPPHE
ncbi:hypothetical protein [Streptomyces sp. SAI-090]|jgi:Mrp family chromosome partitioning ATPase|uniref:hypothetical protein n=1 Tax=Streptomyces sp. SAI-090 TaxID=2940545 RepID=UPI0024755DC4|nr:hypothetical protein [Streptomyces sp. SAI-090]MDH6522023.1 Mrp family chromosome partitioning ATPase [Streptomyces sp. SAI-090]MDH6522503.1 Mrp family chromosome partitioning ATPase [Streptomyces sp. SAI-090]